MPERYSNKRMMFRSGGRFRAAQASDVGIMGICPVCNHFLIRVYEGPTTGTPDPRAFRNRCFNCEPKTDAEKE